MEKTKNKKNKKRKNKESKNLNLKDSKVLKTKNLKNNKGVKSKNLEDSKVSKSKVFNNDKLTNSSRNKSNDSKNKIFGVSDVSKSSLEKKTNKISVVSIKKKNIGLKSSFNKRLVFIGMNYILSTFLIKFSAIGKLRPSKLYKKSKNTVIRILPFVYKIRIVLIPTTIISFLLILVWAITTSVFFAEKYDNKSGKSGVMTMNSIYAYNLDTVAPAPDNKTHYLSTYMTFEANTINSVDLKKHQNIFFNLHFFLISVEHEESSYTRGIDYSSFANMEFKSLKFTQILSKSGSWIPSVYTWDHFVSKSQNVDVSSSFLRDHTSTFNAKALELFLSIQKISANTYSFMFCFIEKYCANYTTDTKTPYTEYEKRSFFPHMSFLDEDTILNVRPTKLTNKIDDFNNVDNNFSISYLLN